MRWIPFIILVVLAVVCQTTIGEMFTFSTGGIGRIGPDLLAVVALFVVLHARQGTDAMLAAWLLGMAMDVTAGGTASIGPMAIGYAVAAGVLFRLREAFFSQWAVTQGFLGMLFCLIAHGIWVTVQVTLNGGWWAYGAMLTQMLALAVYTGFITPIAHAALARIQKWILVAPARGRRRR